MSETQNNISQTGFNVIYRDDGIVVYKFEDVRRSTVDAWAQTFQQHEEEALTANRHLLRLMDIRDAGMPTPYSTAKATDLVKNSLQDLRKSYAILAADSLGAEIMRNAMRHLNTWIDNTRLFTDEQEAYAWLDARRIDLGE